MYRCLFLWVSLLLVAGVVAWSIVWRPALWTLVVLLPLITLGLRDVLQTRHAVLRNWPLIGRFRYVFEAIRPEIQQYFVESNTDGAPFNREFRAVAYQRAKDELDTLPFGTQNDVYRVGYEWMNHSLAPRSPAPEPPRIRIGGPDCTQPYDASYLNTSAMSFGSLSSNAVRAVNRGARAGGFAQNTGEGGISPYHLEGGGDLIYQVGTGYFGCRAADGSFSPERFEVQAARDTVKMIELKLSQGAKPGHGGILPAKKVTEEIAAIRGVPVGQRVDSPPAHRAFDTPVGMLTFIAQMRELARGKPVGIKLCVGDRADIFSLCKAMLATGITPDYIAVDGGEGGTGAAPLEFSNSVGWPMREGVVFVHNALVGSGLRERVKIIASGKIITGFHMVRALAMGADLCAAARAFMFSLGCIQARRCNSNHCPVGVATQTPGLVKGLHVGDKADRVKNYHAETVHGFLELLGAAGLPNPEALKPRHVWRRVDALQSLHYAQIYHYLQAGALLQDPVPAPYRMDWEAATEEQFHRVSR